jgi:hypothetical protein
MGCVADLAYSGRLLTCGVARIATSINRCIRSAARVGRGEETALREDQGTALREAPRGDFAPRLALRGLHPFIYARQRNGHRGRFGGASSGAVDTEFHVRGKSPRLGVVNTHPVRRREVQTEKPSAGRGARLRVAARREARVPGWRTLAVSPGLPRRARVSRERRFASAARGKDETRAGKKSRQSKQAHPLS